MTEPLRMPQSVQAALRQACLAHPDQRVMQVIVNACGNDPFYVEDEDARDRLADYATGATALSRIEEAPNA